jgi:hypothetical protein
VEQDPVHRETFVALRARREACRLARVLHNPPLDPYQFYCRHCGQPLDGLDLEPSNHICCDACGCYTLVPPDSARELRRRRLRRWGRRPRSLLHDAVIAVYLLVALILVFAAL